MAHSYRNLATTLQALGVEDEARNSKGEWTSGGGSVGSSHVDSPAFKAWFGKSKVVDASGKPLVVYHGSSADIKKFDLAHSGTGRGGAAEKAIFFSSDVGTANISADVTGGLDFGGAGGGSVYPVYLSLQNPLVSQMEFYNSAEMAKEISAAKAAGHDGVVFPKLKTGGESGTIAV